MNNKEILSANEELAYATNRFNNADEDKSFGNKQPREEIRQALQESKKRPTGSC